MTSLVDKLCDWRSHHGRGVRTALVGAGQMGRGLAAQIGRVEGLDLAVAVDVDRQRAVTALKLAGRTDPVDHPDPTRVAEGQPVALDNVEALWDLPVDVVVEATGIPGVGSEVAFRSLLARRHVVTLNAEADVTVGLQLARLARSVGVTYTIAHGDEPVAAKELVDFAHDLALEVICAGKGKNNPFDPQATPASVEQEALRRHMNPKMLASFVDGSKTSIEMAALANATGLVPDVIGMHGPTAQVAELSSVFVPGGQGGVLSAPGRVDFAYGPAPGVFCVVASDDEVVAEEMAYLGMGPGPYWTLYRPYHLASLEAPRTIALAVLDGEPGLQAAGWHAEVVAVAKRDLAPGDVLASVGGADVRGVIHPVDAADGLLPLGLCEGAVMAEPVRAGEPLPYGSVRLPDSPIVHLRGLQDRLLT